MRLLWIILYCYGTVCIGQSVTVRGIVVDADSRRVLPGASVQLSKTIYTAQTDENGVFDLPTLKLGRYEMVVRYVGYLTYKQVVNIESDTTLKINLTAFATDLDEVVVSNQMSSQTNELVISTTTLTQKQLRNAPSIGGEHDIARTLTLTPGIKSDNESNAGLYVRGGSPDQNLFLLQHVPLYKNSHFFGFLSSFNSDIIQQVDLYKGGFPARFGGRLSSVLDVTIKSADMRRTRVQGAVGILSSRLSVETPIVKERVSLLLAARRSYFDIFARLFRGSGTTSGPDYHFYDLNATLTARLGKRNVLQLFMYQDNDRLRAGAVNSLEDLQYDQKWNSTIAGLALTTQITSLLTNLFEVNSSAYKLAQTTKQTQQSISTLYEFANIIRTNTIRNTAEWKPVTSYLLRVGGTYVHYQFQPGNLTFTGQGAQGNHSTDSTTMTEFSGFLENEVMYKRMNVKAGLRFATYQIVRQNNYSFIEPRLLLHYNLTPVSSIKAAYARMNQPLHLLTNPGFGIPVDLWFPAKGPIRPQSSNQISVAYNRDLVLSSKLLEISVEGYYKKMNHIIAYQDGYSSQDFTMLSQNVVRNWEEVMTTGQGTAYGGELFLQKKQGRLTGWLGYTLSWTIHQFDAFNLGKPFYARQDRRHDLSIVGSYQLGKRWSINGTWIYQTGQAITLPQAVYGQIDHRVFFKDQPSPYSGILFTYGERNSYRIKATHRLDISVHRKTTHRWGVGQLELSIYNVYNRQNPYFYYLALGNKVKSVSLFQLVPSLSYSFNIYTGKK